jgi:hypothetical protein
MRENETVASHPVVRLIRWYRQRDSLSGGVVSILPKSDLPDVGPRVDMWRVSELVADKVIL